MMPIGTLDPPTDYSCTAAPSPTRLAAEHASLSRSARSSQRPYRQPAFLLRVRDEVRPRRPDKRWHHRLSPTGIYARCERRPNGFDRLAFAKETRCRRVQLATRLINFKRQFAGYGAFHRARARSPADYPPVLSACSRMVYSCRRLFMRRHETPRAAAMPFRRLWFRTHRYRGAALFAFALQVSLDENLRQHQPTLVCDARVRLLALRLPAASQPIPSRRVVNDVAARRSPAPAMALALPPSTEMPIVTAKKRLWADAVNDRHQPPLQNICAQSVDFRTARRSHAGR
jgi:hypothetical protein